MRRLTSVFLLLAVLLVAYGGDDDKKEEEKKEVAPPASITGNALDGKKLFEKTVVGSQPGCVTCHSLEPDRILVGPSLAEIGADAGSRVADQSAEAYLRQSLLEPDAHTVEGFAVGVMPAGLADDLSEQQVADLVAFLLTLK